MMTMDIESGKFEIGDSGEKTVSPDIAEQLRDNITLPDGKDSYEPKLTIDNG